MNPAITDAERFPTVSDRNSRLACTKMPSESDSQELVNMGTWGTNETRSKLEGESFPRQEAARLLYGATR